MKSMKKLAALLLAFALLVTAQPSVMTMAASQPHQPQLKGQFGTFHPCSMDEEQMKKGDFYDSYSGEEFWHTKASQELNGAMMLAAGQSTEDTGLFRDQLTGLEAEIYDGIVSAGGVSASNNAVTVTYHLASNETLQGVADKVKDCYGRAMYAYEYDHFDQLYFQVRNGIEVSMRGTNNIMEMIFSFEKSDYYTSSLESQAKSKLSQCVNAGKNQTHVEDKLKAVNQWICDNCTYDDAALSDDNLLSEKNYYAHTAMGLLLKGTGVCESYAKTLKLACMQLNIKCVYVISETHAFNYIKMDDGKWYMIDCTWNDSKDNSSYYDTYFLVSNSPAINYDHQESSELIFPKTASSSYVRVVEHTHTVVTDPAVAATCTQAGKKEGSHCSSCGEVIKAQETIPALGHAYDNGTVTKEATCVAKGTKTFTCTRCNNTKTEEIAIDSQKHTGATVIKNQKVATTTEEGYTGDTCCADCGAVLEQGSIIEKLPSSHTHTVVTDPAVAATCTQAGKKEGSHCSSCGEVIKAQETIPALGHAYDNGTVTKEATCVAKGTKTFTCTRCNDTKTEEIAIDSQKHTGATVIKNQKAATTTEEGYTGDTCCADCGAVLEQGSIIKKLPSSHTHTVVTDPAVDATCTDSGKTEGSHCSVCGKIINPQTIVEPLGHKVEKEIAEYATLEEDGCILEHCIRCNELFDEEIIIHPASFKLSKTSYTYDGKTHKPSLTIYDADGYKISSEYYNVTYPSGCKNVGKYSIKVVFQGPYTGSKTLTYKINPAKPTLSSVTKGKKSFTAKWKKKTTQVTGYELQYSTSKTFASGNKTVKIKSNKTTSKTIKSLKSKKKYYVRIRTYHTVKKVNYYSAWSSVKNVTTK